MNARIREFDSKCMSEWKANTKVNSDRLLIQGASAGLNNKDMSEFVTQNLGVISPYRFWLTNVYNNIGGDDNHHVTCYDCFINLHFQNKYNVVISSLMNNTVANTTATES